MKDYRSVRPVEQFDSMSCWAASIEWWKSYMSPTYPCKSQFDIVGNRQIKGFTYYSQDDNDGKSGGFDPRKSELLFYAEGMNSENLLIGELKPKKLNNLIRKGPIVIIFNDYNYPEDYHANVIIEQHETCGASYYVVMEPRTGTFEMRFINWYQRGSCYIGYAKQSG